MRCMLPPTPMVSSSGCATTIATLARIICRCASAASMALVGPRYGRFQRIGPAWRIPADHRRAELREPLGVLGDGGVVRPLALMLRGEAERGRHPEILERAHLPVEPPLRVRAEPVG